MKPGAAAKLKQGLLLGLSFALTFIPIVAEAVAMTYTVTNNNDSGLGSLRQAIIDSNLNDPGLSFNTIDFTLAPNQTINLLSALPTITNALLIDSDNGVSVVPPAPNQNVLSIATAVELDLRQTAPPTAIAWAGNIQNNGSLEITGFQAMSYSGAISGTGSFKLYGGAPGNLTLNNTTSSTYSGNTSIEDNTTLFIAQNNALPLQTPVLFNDASQLVLNNSIQQTIGAIGVVSGGGTPNGSGITINNGTLTTNTNTNSTTVTIIAGTGTFVKQGTSNLTLSGTNTFTGQTTINEGSLRFPAGSAWVSPVTITNTGVTSALEMNGGVMSESITGDNTLNSSLIISGNFTPTAAISNVAVINQTAGISTFNPVAIPTNVQRLTLGGGTLNLNGTLLLANNSQTSINGGIFNLSPNITFTNPTNGVLTVAGGSMTGNSNNKIVNNATMNWSGGTILTPITNGSNSALNVSGSVATGNSIGLDVGSTGYNINVANNSTFTANNAISGYTTLNVAAGSTFVLNNTGSLSNGITLNNGGTFNFAGGAFVGNVMGSGPSIMNVNAGTFSSVGSVTVNNLVVANAATFVSNNLTTVSTLATINAGGTLRLGTDLIVPANATLTNAGTITMQNNNLLMSTGTILNNNGTLSTTGTIGLAAGATAYALNVGAGGTLTVNNAVSGYTSPLTVTGGGTVILNPNGSLSNSISLTGSTFTFNGGTYTGDVIGVTAGSTMNINSALTPQGAISVYALNIGALGNLMLSNNLTTPLNGTLTNAGVLTMNGYDLLMSTGSTLTNNATLSTSGSIGRASGGTGYTFNVGGAGTLTVNNSISGYNTLNVAAGGNVILNNGGSLSNGIALTGSTFTINGGTFTGNVTTAGGATTMNVNSAFTAPGSISVGTLNVNNGGIFTPSNAVTATALNVNAGGTLLLTNNITGSITNVGTLTHTANAIRTITGNFTQSGTVNIGITSPQQYSQFQVNGNTTLNGGLIAVTLPNATAINGGEVFNIITSPNPIIVNRLPTVSDQNYLFLSFTPRITGNSLQLIANRLGYEFVNQVPALDGVAGALDALIAKNQFNPLLGALDEQTSLTGYEQALTQLVPTGLNGSYITQGPGGREQIFTRLEALRTAGIDSDVGIRVAQTGYAAGDMMQNQGSYGPMVFGSTAKQSSRAGLPGYNSVTAGFGLLGDVPVLEYFRVGLGASYANSAVKQSNNTGSNTRIGSTQAMAYGSATYGPLFLDTVLSAGFNNYHGKRNIVFMGATATSAYNGFQYAAKAKGGFTLPCYQLEVSPMGSLEYMGLNVNRYTETGAPGLNLTVNAMQTTAVRAGLGGRVADRSQEEDFFPEIHAFYIIDVRNPNVLITSRFVDGGGTFVSTGVLPPKTGITVGASLTALVSDNFMINGGYDLEAKKSFRSHSASLKFKWLF